MWINVGEQQFHLPTRNAQVIDGHIGVVVPDLDALESRLQTVADGLKGSRFSFERSCRLPCGHLPLGQSLPLLPEPRPGFGDMTLGIPYVEFSVRPGTVQSIIGFYQAAFDAPVVRGERCRGRAWAGKNRPIASG